MRRSKPIAHTLWVRSAWDRGIGLWLFSAVPFPRAASCIPTLAQSGMRVRHIMSSDTYRKSFQAWHELVDSRVKSLVALAAGRALGREHALFPEFIRVYVQHIPIRFAEGLSDEHLLDFLEARYGFVRSRSGGVVIRVGPGIRSENTRGFASTTVEVLTEDMPYIVSSISAELKRSGRSILATAHPIVRVGRNAGELTEIARGVPEGDVAHESWAYLQITSGSEAEDDALAERLRRGIECLGQINRDAVAMVEEVDLLRRAETAFRGGTYPDEGMREVAPFIEFLKDENFTFLGSRAYQLDGGAVESEKSGLGLLGPQAGSGPFSEDLERAIQAPFDTALKTGEPLLIYKLDLESPVVADERLDLLAFMEFTPEGEPREVYLVLGLWSPNVEEEKVRSIPTFRLKVEWALESMGVMPGSHLHRRAKLIFNSIPKEFLLQASRVNIRDELLFSVNAIDEQCVAAFTQLIARGLRLVATVMVPFRNFRTSRCDAAVSMLCARFAGAPLRYHVVANTLGLTRVYFLVDFDVTGLSDRDLRSLEADLTEMFETTEFRLEREIERLEPKEHGRRNLADMVEALPEAYRASHDVASIVADLHWLEDLREEGSVRADFRLKQDGDETLFNLKIYSRERLELSRVLPVLDFMRLTVVDESHARVCLPEDRGNFYIHEFRAHPPRVGRGGAYAVLSEGDAAEFAAGEQDGASGPLAESERLQLMAAAVVRILQGDAEQDRLFGLCLTAEFDWNSVALMVAYRNYFFQLWRDHSRLALNRTLVENGEITRLILVYFQAGFVPLGYDLSTTSPSLSPSPSASPSAAVAAARAAVVAGLKTVENIDEDRVLRRMLSLVDATVRTNFFRRDVGDPIVLKFRGDRIVDRERNSPWVETYVNHPDVEGIHLRMGPVARGGIRWSDRTDDYRTEVLGLVRTQDAKNAVIVPRGAKGGFILKRRLGDARPTDERAKSGYRLFIRGLLGITDNREDGGVITPEGVEATDGKDEYLVVAADKGTATFSDIANEISDEHGFWLGDAFASGGSNGYSHKDLAITARGAWESVKRHFWEMGLNPEKDPITVLGIGDMSGDVFGNGMLLSRSMKLVAAFNHMHVFLDPDPGDPERSWVERRRLFELPRSRWSDYDPSLISPGGGVFERASKEIPLSSALQSLLGTTRESVNGNELISMLLKLDVDLIWNGGIGTYIRADDQSHLEVGDKSNDAVRVRASEVRARVLAEGGNLGATQAARVQLDRGGMRLFTDALDNSAGVDCSDYEVNIKILLDSAIAGGVIAAERRTELLMGVTESVCQLVLGNNRRQGAAIALERIRSRERSDEFRAIARLLDNRGEWPRMREDVDGPSELDANWSPEEGLARPVLANLLACAKNRITQHLLGASLVRDRDLGALVLGRYFPEDVVALLDAQLLEHPLRSEIVSTHLANRIINEMGSTFFYRMAVETARSVPEIARAYFFANAMLTGVDFRESIQAMEPDLPAELVYQIYLDFSSITELTVKWILANRDVETLPLAVVDDDSQRLEELKKHFPKAVEPADLATLRERIRVLAAAGVPADLAEHLYTLKFLGQPMSVLQIADATGVGIERATTAYIRIARALELPWLIRHLDAVPVLDEWDRVARDSLRISLMNIETGLTMKALKDAGAGDGSVEDVVVEPFLERERRVLRDVRQRVNLVRASAPESFVPLFVIRDLFQKVLAKR